MNLNHFAVLICALIAFVRPEDEIPPEKLLCSPRFSLVTDFSVNDCVDSYYVQKFDNCLPGCFPKPNKPITACESDDECPPGFKCPSHAPGALTRCAVDEDSCFKYYTDYNKNPYFNAMWKPDCLLNGEWAPKQCKGEKANGRCFCYDGKGNRIFGHSFSQNADDMTCACSIRKAELEASGIPAYSTLHCDSMGNYEPLQCDSDYCWCVETKTGKINGTIVPEAAMKLLPCYTQKDVGENYLRQCESEKYAQVTVAEKLRIHGTINANFYSVFCDADGSYASYKLQNDEVFCVWRDNSVIASWHVPVSSELSEINCNCARDSKLFELNGMSFMLKCSQNGNYEPMQRTKGQYYCVDSDGFAISEVQNDEPDCSKISH